MTSIYAQIYRDVIGTSSVTVINVGNEIGEVSSNPGFSCMVISLGEGKF